MMGSGREPGKETERYERIRRAKTNIYEASEEERDNAAGTVMRPDDPREAIHSFDPDQGKYVTGRQTGRQTDSKQIDRQTYR
jgi:hypothetical protein